MLEGGVPSATLLHLPCGFGHALIELIDPLLDSLVQPGDGAKAFTWSEFFTIVPKTATRGTFLSSEGTYDVEIGYN